MHHPDTQFLNFGVMISIKNTTVLPVRSWWLPCLFCQKIFVWYTFYLLLLCCIHDFNISDKIQGVSSIALRCGGCGAENTKRDNRCLSGAKTPVQNQTGPTSDQWPVVRCPCDSWDHGAPVITQWHRLQSHNSDELNINKQIVRLLLLGWRWHRLSCGICSEATRKMSWGTELWVSGIKFGEWVRGIFARTLLGWVQRKCEIIISASLNRDTGTILLTTLNWTLRIFQIFPKYCEIHEFPSSHYHRNVTLITVVKDLWLGTWLKIQSWR